MASHIRFNEDNEDEYSPSDSEDELDERDKQLLKKARRPKKVNDDSENEVLGVHSDSDSSSNESDLAQSDIEGNDQDDLPDVRAWGKDKRNYYSTDYVDPDYGGFDGKDATYAAIEEEEAKNLQRKLAEQLDDDDFNLNFLVKKTVGGDTKTAAEESVQSDLSKLSKRQKIEILQKDAPELFGLMNDFKEQMTLVNEYLHPIIVKHRENRIPVSDAMDFVKEHYHLVLNYCMNIYMYLLLKASQQKVHNHPVVKRLCQFRKLLIQIWPTFEEVIKPQIREFVTDYTEQEYRNMKRRREEEMSSKSKKNAPKKKKKVELKEERSSSSLKDGEEEEEIGEEEEEFGEEEEYEVVLKKKVKKIKTIEKKKEVKKNEDEKKNEEEKKSNVKKQTAISTAKRVKALKKKGDMSSDDNSDNEEGDGAVKDDENAIDQEEVDNEDLGEERRAITYQMAKNKGLMPRRKKEQRNPRVKHKNKFRKAKIRRKGAVREVRKELSRYGGEASGIKATVTKSIKFKS